MSKNNKSQAPHTKNQHDEQMQALAQEVAEHDDVQIVAEVNIDNKIVSDVLIIRDSEGNETDNSTQQAKLSSQNADEQPAAEEPLEAIKQQAQDLTEQATSLAQSHKQAVADGADELLKTAKEGIDELKQNAERAQETVANKVQQLTEQAENQAKQLKTQLQQTKADLLHAGDELKQQVSETIDTARTETEAAVLTGSVAVHDKVAATKDKLQTLLEQGKSTLELKVQALDEKYGASEKLAELGESVTLASESVKQEAQAWQTSAEQSLQAAKQAGEAYDKTHKQTGMATKLGKLGAYLAAAYGANQAKNKQYQAVNLQQDSFAKDAFHEQSSQVANYLFGAKAATAQNFANKFIPAGRLETLSEAVYQKVAQWADAWAMKDLQQDARFAIVETLSDDEKERFVQDIAHQNRALAVLGGVAGLAGLKGVLADMAWLLMVSLKTVYQVAAIYGKPLQGKQGIKQVYGILAGANLEKLQEKQVILTALALGSTMLANAQQTGVKQQLTALANRYRESQPYAKQFVDLDKLNPSWLHKLLPIGSVAVGAYYNNQLIDEVIGTALATFTDGSGEIALLEASMTEKTQE
ncbi:EcsC protein family protein [Moraxella cuniculi DSM 21768]|uniref:EcsC protein family protein n=1 Tax=Moraxella cuniculi DSM 21768 TaxID=1122245 RepID=A0A1N7E559_9GAMM|nr:EcsC family protein [Moraxella cuniculi]OOS06649.1 hypothetical protein B0189_04755 [Moraxella cuniculi]SIR83210.1 EcsC protein family protein [Moraxella cuniculi DSM 21768]